MLTSAKVKKHFSAMQKTSDSFSFSMGGWELDLERIHKTGIILPASFKPCKAMEQVGKKKDYGNNFGVVSTEFTKTKKLSQIFKFLMIRAVKRGGSCLPEVFDEALTLWRVEVELPCSQIQFHQEAFLLTQNYQVRKSPGK